MEKTATVEKRGRGRPRNKLKVPPSAIPGMALRMSAAALSKETGLSEKDSELIKRAASMTVDEFQGDVRGRLQGVAMDLANQLKEEINRLQPMQKVISLGILMDKLNTQPRSVAQALHIHLAGDPGSALKAVFGPSADSILAATPTKGSKAPNYLEPVDVTATDATPPQASDSKSTARNP